MHLLPIVERELRVASRRPRTYYSRLFAAVLALLFAGHFVWLFSRMPGTSASGRQVFVGLVQLAFLYCLFAGTGSTADCLSSEKREGTMGLLFLTHLKGYDVVLGKLVATSLAVIYGIGATVPVLALCLIAGGVQSGEFWRTVLAVLNTLFFSLSTGLFVSASSRDQRKASQTSSAVMLLFAFGLPAFGEWLRLKTGWVDVGSFLKMLSPAQALGTSTVSTPSVRHFWWSLLVLHLVAWLLLAGASWILPRAWQDKPAVAELLSWRERWRRRLFGSETRRPFLRLGCLERNPYFWLATRARKVMVESWLAFCGIILVAGACGWFFRQTVPLFVICVGTAVVLHSLAKMQLTAAACERLAEDKQSGTLEVLLSTPLTVRDIVRGQWLALKRQFGGLLIATVLLDAFMLLAVIAKRESQFFSSPDAVANCVLFFAAGAILLLADAVALGWTGMWQALATRHSVQARSRAVSYILFFPWAVLMPLLMFIATSQPAGFTLAHLLGVWVGVSMLNNLVFTLHARQRLFADFRVRATERFQPSGGRGVWAWLRERQSFRRWTSASGG